MTCALTLRFPYGDHRLVAFEVTPARVRFALDRLAHMRRPYSSRPTPVEELYQAHWGRLVPMGSGVPYPSQGGRYRLLDELPERARTAEGPFLDRLSVTLAGAALKGPGGFETARLTKDDLTDILAALEADVPSPA